MTQKEFLVEVARHLETAAIPFMLAGSFCSSFHSHPRATNDIDFVIDPTPTQLDHWLTLLGDQIYASRDAAHAALRERSMFNIIDTKKGYKADLIYSARSRLIPFFRPMLGTLAKLGNGKVRPIVQKRVGVGEWMG